MKHEIAESAGTAAELVPLGVAAPLRYFAFGSAHTPPIPQQEWSVTVYFIGNNEKEPVKFSVLKTDSSSGKRVWGLSFNPLDYNGKITRRIFRNLRINLTSVKRALEKEAENRFLEGGCTSHMVTTPTNVPS